VVKVLRGLSVVQWLFQDSIDALLKSANGRYGGIPCVQTPFYQTTASTASTASTAYGTYAQKRQ
jgi:hypothetical protein